MRLVPLVFALAFASLACRSASDKAAPTAPAERPTIVAVTSTGARKAVKVELAITDPERQKGLMFRREMGRDDGMLFFFEEEAPHPFWMRNTYIPLDMIHLDSTGRVVGIVRDAAPQTDTSRAIGRPSRFVLEVNGGWAALNGVEIGDRFELGEAIEAARRGGKWKD